MITLTNGKTLGTGDLNILIRDANGCLIDPVQISFSIFQLSSTVPVQIRGAYDYDLSQPNSMPPATLGMPEGAMLVGQPRMVPVRASQGTYWARITIPTTWQGVYRLVWYVVEYPASPADSQQPSVPQVENMVFEDFVVQNIDPTSNSFEAPSVSIQKVPTTTTKYTPAIMYVRELISDENPDRNYHFRPPTPGKVVAGYTTRVGYIWLDSTILRMLDISIAKLNTWNTKNLYGWTLDNIPSDWGKAAALGAAALCLSKEAARWTADEFSYSLNGVSLDINKAQGYMSLGQTYQQEFNAWAPLITANRPFSAGLRQQRWLLG
jgi:hypothetical protein